MILEGKKILITGGTGSLGKVLVRRILSGELGTPEKLVVFSRDEAKQHFMRMSYMHKTVSTDETIYNNFNNILEFRIGDVRDYADMVCALKGIDIVVAAAALKQVPACEYFPHQAVLTNCIGISNLVQAINEHSMPVKTVVSVSTDKACKPINVMGMTKAIQEKIVTAANVLNPDTRFVCVRYGNVLASRGSVIPLFHDQIKNGGPVTITVPQMTRFLMCLNQAVDTVFAAMREAKPGETYIPDAPSSTVENIAKALIADRDIKVRITGIRPGEKLHEILICEEEAIRTVRRGNYYAIAPMLPELAQMPEHPALTEELSSSQNVLDLQGTIALLKQHKLMIEDVQSATDGDELIR